MQSVAFRLYEEGPARAYSTQPGGFEGASVRQGGAGRASEQPTKPLVALRSAENTSRERGAAEGPRRGRAVPPRTDTGGTMDRGTSRPHVLIGAAALLCVLVVPLTATGSVGGSGDPEATTSGVKKQVKKLKKKVKNLQAQVDEIAKQPGPQGPPGEQGAQGPAGGQGEQGQPGQDATNLFAYIRDPQPVTTSPAVVEYRSGVTAVQRPHREQQLPGDLQSKPRELRRPGSARIRRPVGAYRGHGEEQACPNDLGRRQRSRSHMVQRGRVDRHGVRDHRLLLGTVTSPVARPLERTGPARDRPSS